LESNYNSVESNYRKLESSSIRTYLVYFVSPLVKVKTSLFIITISKFEHFIVAFNILLLSEHELITKSINRIQIILIVVFFI